MIRPPPISTLFPYTTLFRAYRNIIPPTVFPVVLLFLEMPATEVDANVHPAKTEVRFRQHGFVHDFVRESVRAALMKARPVPQFTREILAQPTAGVALSPGAAFVHAEAAAHDASGFVLTAPAAPAGTAAFAFDGNVFIDDGLIAASQSATVAVLGHRAAANECRCG